MKRVAIVAGVAILGAASLSVYLWRQPLSIFIWERLHLTPLATFLNPDDAALQEEISRIRADNSLIEEDIIKILDLLDAENKKILKEGEFLKQEEAGLNENKKKLSDDVARLKTELENFKGQRTALAEKIEKTILKKYERIVSSKDGLAVVPVVNDACQGCFRIMPPQVINEIKMKKEPVVCDSCARILYIEE